MKLSNQRIPFLDVYSDNVKAFMDSLANQGGYRYISLSERLPKSTKAKIKRKKYLSKIRQP